MILIIILIEFLQTATKLNLIIILIWQTLPEL